MLSISYFMLVIDPQMLHKHALKYVSKGMGQIDDVLHDLKIWMYMLHSFLKKKNFTCFVSSILTIFAAFNVRYLRSNG